ncbi:hypothetical protein [Micromonospora rubida]|uniref:hypothetical protein n=1 Tax=Micromonospora rubida TaxID=2697657 RepID=UPI001376F935|nr:hypothetical protein [Micromonospora rubida]
MTGHHAVLLGRGTPRAFLARARRFDRTALGRGPLRYVMSRGERDLTGGRLVFPLPDELQV